MPHTCEDCGEKFDTLSGKRLHDCPGDEEPAEQERRKQDEEFDSLIRKLEHEEELAVKRKVSDALIDALERARDGDHAAVHQALTRYERQLIEEWENYEDGEYWGFHRVFFGPAVEGLETAVQAEGWPYLLDVLDAYWPDVTLDFDSYPEHEAFSMAETDDWEQFPHVSHVLVTVVGKHMVRTRLMEGVEAIPADALEYQLLFHRHPGDESPWIDSMSYGWGIGHPEHDVEGTIETLVEGEYEIWAGTAIEHALYADQYAATELIEDLFEAKVVSDPALILQAVGLIERGYVPDSSGHWDWETLYPTVHEAGQDWDPEVRERLRSVVEECGLAKQLPDKWTFEDIVV
jgi:predicted  nucleic acid-binding Zn-ribbon protein